MDEKGVIQLSESSDVADDIQKKIRTAGVRGLDFEKAKEMLKTSGFEFIDTAHMVIKKVCLEDVKPE